MEYYKIIYNNAVIGVASSKQFIRYSPVTNSLARCQKDQGQYITYKGGLYRDSWMKPIYTEIDCIEAEIISITEDEYNILFAALQTNEEIEVQESEDIIPQEPEIIIDNPTIEFVRTSKINEMSYTCRQTIEAGFDLELRNEIHHFSLNTQDQLNLITLSAMAQTQSLIPYHADGEECIFYSNEEIDAIVETATAFKIYHTTYYNALKGYINALETIEEISAITYGTEIPDEYKSDVLRALEQ